MSLEEYIRREAYSSGQAEGKLARAAAARRADRRTREERMAQKKRLVLSLVLLTVVSLTMLLTLTAKTAALTLSAKSDELPGPVSTVTVRAIQFPVEDVQEDFENEKIEAALLARSTKLENVTVTHYDLCAACCGKTDGITSSGVKAVPGVTVSVDPSVIPLGSDVLVDYGDGEVHYYRATDTGGAVCGDHIDLCVSSHAEAVALGVRTATVWWCEP